MDEKAGTGHKSMSDMGTKFREIFNSKSNSGDEINIPFDSSDSNEAETKTKHKETKSDKTEMIKVDKKDYEELLNSVETLSKEKEDLKDQLLRKSAEMDNFRRRTLLEKQQLIEFGNEKLLSSFLSVIDDFSNALEASRKTDADNPILTGIELIYQKTLKFLSDSGVKPIESHVGKAFDVNLHEAIMVMPSDYPEGHIVQEVSTGYYLGDKVLRHTKVITSSGPTEN